MILAAVMLVTLIWDANKESDLAGYNVYSGVQSATYTNKATVGLVTTNEVRGLVPGVTYFFAVTAFNTSGAESDFSNEVSVYVPEAEPGIAITPSKFLAIGLTWPAVGGAVYQVESSMNLDANWSARSPEMTFANNDTMKWAEACDEPDRFYRVVRLR